MFSSFVFSCQREQANMLQRLIYGILLLVQLANIAAADDCLLLGSHPADKTTGVNISESIHLRFSQAMDATTLTHLRLVQRVGEKPLEVAVQYSTDLTQALFMILQRCCFAKSWEAKS